MLAKREGRAPRIVILPAKLGSWIDAGLRLDAISGEQRAIVLTPAEGLFANAIEVGSEAVFPVGKSV